MSVTTKLFEIRDSATFIPVLATKLVSDVPEEAYLISRAGYANVVGPSAVMVTRLEECKSANDPSEWGFTRTMQIAHQHIEKNFNNLKTGDVIDVQFIIGERNTPKLSERLEATAR